MKLLSLTGLGQNTFLYLKTAFCYYSILVPTAWLGSNREKHTLKENAVFVVSEWSGKWLSDLKKHKYVSEKKRSSNTAWMQNDFLHLNSSQWICGAPPEVRNQNYKKNKALIWIITIIYFMLNRCSLPTPGLDTESF